MLSLLKIQKVRSKDNVKGLRMLYNHVESCVRNLKALKLEVKGYGSLLILLLKEKLPDDLVIIISRKFGSSIWTLNHEQPTSTSSNQILAQLVILGIVVANARQKERNRVLIVLRPLVVFCCKQLQVRLSL